MNMIDDTSIEQVKEMGLSTNKEHNIENTIIQQPPWQPTVKNRLANHIVRLICGQDACLVRSPTREECDILQQSPDRTSGSPTIVYTFILVNDNDYYYVLKLILFINKNSISKVQARLGWLMLRINHTSSLDVISDFDYFQLNNTMRQV